VANFSRSIEKNGYCSMGYSSNGKKQGIWLLLDNYNNLIGLKDYKYDSAIVLAPSDIGPLGNWKYFNSFADVKTYNNSLDSILFSVKQHAEEACIAYNGPDSNFCYAVKNNCFTCDSLSSFYSPPAGYGLNCSIDDRNGYLIVLIHSESGMLCSIQFSNNDSDKDFVKKYHLFSIRIWQESSPKDFTLIRYVNNKPTYKLVALNTVFSNRGGVKIGDNSIIYDYSRRQRLRHKYVINSNHEFVSQRGRVLTSEFVQKLFFPYSDIGWI
jgi:hypothetical protein